MNTLQKASESELAVAYELTKLKGLVSLPVTHNSQYDLIVDFGGKLSRIQVKRAYVHDKRKPQTLCVETRRIMAKHSGAKNVVAKKYDDDSYDYLIAHHPDSNRFWVIPFKICSKYSAQAYITTKVNLKYVDYWEQLT